MIRMKIFPIGGCKVLRMSAYDTACIVAAGVTVHEALKAYDQLLLEGIYVAVIDLYCVKPLDVATLSQIANAAHNTIITVEDHYAQGGIGEAIAAALCNEVVRVERFSSIGIANVRNA